MLNSINEYIISNRLREYILVNNEFIFINKFNCYFKLFNITDDIDLILKIYKDDKKRFSLKDDSIKLIDNNYNQLYYPFYEDKSFKYLENVIKKYNDVMDELVEKNILKRKVKVKKKNLYL